MGLVHPGGCEEPRSGGEDGDDADRGADSGEVGDGSAEQGADREAAVTPESVDTDRPGSPGGVGDVADGGEEGGVYRGGAEA